MLIRCNARSQQTGFSLIELGVTLAVMGILFLLAMPNYSEYITNSRVRSAAEGVNAGLQQARIEAIKRNTPVQLVLTDDTPTGAAITASASGKNWVIRFSTDGGATYSFVSGWNGSEAAKSGVAYGAPASTFTFGGLGGADVGGNFDFTNSTAGTCVKDGGKVRCMRVVLSTAGETRMCDPSITLGTTKDTRAC